jgi:hypothetical protein
MAPVITGRQLLAAVGAWLLASGVAAGATVLALRSLAPDSASDPNTLAPIIVAEVYALLIAALAVVLRPRFREIVALRRPAARDVALAAAACAAAAGLWHGDRLRLDRGALRVDGANHHRPRITQRADDRAVVRAHRLDGTPSAVVSTAVEMLAEALLIPRVLLDLAYVDFSAVGRHSLKFFDSRLGSSSGLEQAWRLCAPRSSSSVTCVCTATI